MPGSGPELAAIHKARHQEWLDTVKPSTRRAVLGIVEETSEQLHPDLPIARDPAEEKRLKRNAYAKKYAQRRRGYK